MSRDRLQNYRSEYPPVKEAARIQTAIELCQTIFDEGASPEETLLRWRRNARYAGSSDRRAIDDLIYSAARNYEFLTASNAFRTLKTEGGSVSRPLILLYLHLLEGKLIDDIAALFTGEKYVPPALTENEKAALIAVPSAYRDPENAEVFAVSPDMAEMYENSLHEKTRDFHLANRHRAPTILRIHPKMTDRENALTVLRKEFPEANFTETKYSPLGIRVDRFVDIRSRPIYQNGAVDFQDESGQIACLLAQEVLPKKEKTRVADYCAGGGGKSLTLASVSENLKITGSDIAPARLEAFRERVERGHKDSIFIQDQDTFFQTAGKFDAVIADVPCSGTGTLRRNPFDKRILNKAKISEYQNLQREILDQASDFVAEGGYLFYFTCSVLRAENQDNIDFFLSERPEFTRFDLTPATERLFGKEFANQTMKDGYLTLTPHETDTDGFFAACLLRKF